MGLSVHLPFFARLYGQPVVLGVYGHMGWQVEFCFGAALIAEPDMAVKKTKLFLEPDIWF